MRQAGSFYRQPLLHFLVLGALLFLAYDWLDDGIDAPSKEIVVTPGRVDALTASFESIWQRSPTEEERDALIQEFIIEEIYYREALAMGLDRDDTIVRRRMRQKMEFITADLAQQYAPTEKDLLEYLAAHEADYRLDPEISFSHIYFDARHREDTNDNEWVSLLSQLNGSNPPPAIAALGDPISLESTFPLQSLAEIDRIFGSGFGDSLMKLERNRWRGPIRSGYGLHLIHISEFRKGRRPDLEEVKMEVSRDWIAAKTREANQRVIESLQKQYTISIQDK